MIFYALFMSIASPEIRKIAVEAYLTDKAIQQHLADILEQINFKILYTHTL
jgi:hypothetical protein